ncbi:MAG: hypothetical protein R2705_23495 [Ilumatobacteraceae bacterium]
MAADLGHLLGGGAHLRNLRRTRVGPFTIAEATPPEACRLAPVVDMLRGIERVVVDEPTEARVRQGAVLPAWDGTGPWAVMSASDDLLAVYERFRSGDAKPSVVVAGASGQ